MVWKDKFSDATLQAGRNYYEQGMVRELQRTPKGYEAKVGAIYSFNNVKIGVNRDRVTSLYCDCPESKSHAWCSHVAAVLSAVEEIGEENIPSERSIAPRRAAEDDGTSGEETYAYFRMNSLRESLDFSDYLFERGQDLIDDGKIMLRSFRTEYTFLERGMIGVAIAGVQKESGYAAVEMICGPEKVLQRRCGCPECSSAYYTRIGERQSCSHLAALFLLMENYLKKEEDVGDATDQGGSALIEAFRSRRARKRVAESWNRIQAQTLELEPRLLQKDGDFFVDFRIGMRSGKSYLVKELSRFIQMVDEGRDVQYGASAIFNQNIRNFTPKSQEYIAFIRAADDEGKESQRKQYESSLREQERLRYLWKTENAGLTNYEYIKSIGQMPQYELNQQIPLDEKHMDRFFDLAESSQVAYEERKGSVKKKSILKFRVKNPHITLQIAPFADDRGVFQGIELTAAVPELIRGKDGVYYIEETALNQIEPDFARALEPFLALAQKGKVSFRVGRHQLQSFYYTVLPELGEYLAIECKDEDVILEYLLPDVSFAFYLDAEKGEITCRALARYGEQAFSLKDTDGQRHSFRDAFRENEVLEVVRKYFSEAEPTLPVTGWIDASQTEQAALSPASSAGNTDEYSASSSKRGEAASENAELFYCAQDGGALYRLLADGVRELMKLGEVQSSDSFCKLRLIEHPKLRFAVSLHSGLLDLDISSDEISRDELLEVLQSYRQKKDFHRLRNGDFLSLETDSYAMLQDLFETMQISPKEFVSGNMHLPAYRALYLDKMLEGQEAVYTEWDTHFKKLIRDFGTVQNADYPIPELLRPILRGYQKTGYRWLRTLKAGHFGGILADDMGLGKTLQVITVLLAWKEEAGGGTPSLIICPASLVYNWGEEFERYAPELSVCYVTGTQAERREKIRAARQWDVLITSYDLLKRDIDAYEGIEFGCEVIDEAQYIKNHETAAAKAVKLIRTETRYALTGTPIENRLSELWSIFDYLMPGFLYPYKVFRENYEIRIMKEEDEETAARLRRLVSPFILRRLKKDVLKDLPDKIEETRYTRFEEDQQKLYDAQVVHMRQMIARQNPVEFQKNHFQILSELTRIRQICCDPALCFDHYEGGSAKLISCLDLIESVIEGGHRILLFSQFTTMLARIQDELEKREISYYQITGNTPKEKRLAMVREFNGNDVPVFLISLKAGGTGLNLTGADVVIHYDPWWNVAVQNQATDRAHRIGQEKIVTVYKLIAKATIEEKIQKLQESKQDLADQIIGGDQGSSLSNMTQEELLELLG